MLINAIMVTIPWHFDTEEEYVNSTQTNIHNYADLTKWPNKSKLVSHFKSKYGTVHTQCHTIRR